ncbi:MAG: GntR family transcriptional regulator [Solirubrobacteraceae bacterium]|nr:GntR family transcriptional regulator [Patulibacter sp.]
MSTVSSPTSRFAGPHGAPRLASHAPRRPETRSARDTGDSDARRLRDILRCNVMSGCYAEGVLPSEADLMLSHRARRSTVREALAMLREEGVVDRVQGIGTYALCEPKVAAMAGLHGTDRNEILVQDRPTVITRSVMPAADVVADRLGIAVGEPVLCIDYVGRVDGLVVGMATNYMAFPEAQKVERVPFTSDFYTLMADAGVPLGGSEWILSAVNADAHVARLLELEPGAAVMHGEELIWDADGRVYDFAFCYMRTDRFQFSSTDWVLGARGAEPIATSNGKPQRNG